MAASLAQAAPQNDVIIGNGGTGPYPLGWKNFLKDSVSVSENSLTLTSGLDYTVDAANGQITFAHPLTQQTTALVQYQYDPAVAVRTSAQILTPLKVALQQSDSHDTYVSAVVQRSSTQATGSSSSNVALGFGSNWRGSGHNQIGAHWFFDPAVSGTQNNASASSASGFAIMGSADAGKGNLLSFGVNRAEKSLLATDDGLQAGNQISNMSFHLAPETKVVADFGYRHTDSIDPTAPDKTESTAAVTIAPATNMQVKAQVGQVAQTGQEDSNSSTVSITAKPVVSTKTTAGVDLTATTSQTSQGATSSQQTGVGVTVGQDKKIAITTGVNVARNQDVSHQVLSLNTILRPLTTLEIDAGYQSRTADNNDTNMADSLDTKSMQLSIKPARGLKLVGSYGENPTDGSGNPQAMFSRGLGVESAFGKMNLTGGYNWNRAAGASVDATCLKVGLGWKVSANGQFTGGYQQAIGNSMTNGSYPWLNQYSFGYQHKMGDAFSVSFSGSFNQHPGQAVTGTSDVTGNASVGVKF